MDTLRPCQWDPGCTGASFLYPIASGTPQRGQEGTTRGTLGLGSARGIIPVRSYSAGEEIPPCPQIRPHTRTGEQGASPSVSVLWVL